jgi:hypothetical protein
LYLGVIPLNKNFFPSQGPGGKEEGKTGVLIDASLHIGHDGYLRRAVCIKANHKGSNYRIRIIIFFTYCRTTRIIMINIMMMMINNKGEEE